ncbi:hypothetical protein SAMN02910369_03001 [Lachnospiraceae bacterium NE2001]|nr:hypothetical protein SAMN02910369_03001 [Lachnospiraceae bacterium NE2001]
MKKIIAAICICLLVFSGCTYGITNESNESNELNNSVEANTVEALIESSTDAEIEEETEDYSQYLPTGEPDFSEINLSDGRLTEYLEDSIMAGLEEDFGDDNYIIKELEMKYISKEYIDEVEFNSKENVWFGYTLSELAEKFKDTPYVFSLSDDGETIVKPLEGYDDTYEKVLKNVAIGTGVILICVTVSAVSAAVGAEPVSVVFAASAKSVTTMAISNGAISAIITGIVKGVSSGDVDESIAEAALAGSEAFKWGAISGAILGGVSEAYTITSNSAAESTNSVYKLASEAEERAVATYGGEGQVTYLNGKVVEYGTTGATRPDVVVHNGKLLEAIEVKSYDLNSKQCVDSLKYTLKRQVADRIENLPSGSTQRIVLDVTGRDIAFERANAVKLSIQDGLSEIYPNIPIDIVGY